MVEKLGSRAAFKVGGRIEDPYFIERPETQDPLLHDARTLAQSHVIMAPRRFGKTALLQHICGKLSREMCAAYVNCLPIRSAAAFHDQIVDAVLDAYEQKRGRARRLLATWRDILKRPLLTAFERLDEVGGSLQTVGSIRLKFRAQEVDAEGLLRATLEFPERFAEEQDERLLISLDEFQALAALGSNVFSHFKSSMDAQRRVVYLFSGSSLSLLSDVFGQEGTSPLYQMVGRTFLGELPSKHVISFVKRRLRAVHGATLPKEAADRFYERVGGIPYYVQKLGLAIERRLVFEGVQAIGAEHVDIGFDALLDELDLDFQERFTTRFSLQQQTILLAIADDAATSAAIAERQQTAPENLTYSLKKLVGTMILSKDGSAYRVTDRVFGGWLARLRVGGV